MKKISGINKKPEHQKMVFLWVEDGVQDLQRRVGYWSNLNNCFYAYDADGNPWPYYAKDVWWLDESDESPSSDPAEVLLKALEEIRKHMPTGSWFAKTIDKALSQHEQLKQQ